VSIVVAMLPPLHATTPRHLFSDSQYTNHTHSPVNSETHFKVVVVSEEFIKVKTPIQRHRLVNAALKSELEGPVHALSIVAKTPQQWEASSKQVEPSPSCRGGDGSLPPKNG